MFERKDGEADDKFQRKIIRQLRASRLGLGFLTLVIIVGFAVLGFFMFKTSGLVNDTQKQLQTVESQADTVTNLKDKVCGSGLVTESSICGN